MSQILDIDESFRLWGESSAPAPPPSPFPPRRRPLPLDRRGRYVEAPSETDPTLLVACELDDYAATWAEHLRVPVAALARRDGEHDELFLTRLLADVHEHQARHRC